MRMARLALTLMCVLSCDARQAAWPDPLRVEIRGSDYQWTIRYPGADGILGTVDDIVALRDLHVPEGAIVQIELESDDYLYSFRLPEFGVSQVAVPELTFKAAFFSGPRGSSVLLGDQMCGYAHPDLIGRVIVHRPSEFDEWLGQQRGQGASDG